MEKNNWVPVYKGLLEPKHIRKVDTAIWVYLYLLSNANRRNGIVFRKRETIATDLGVSLVTIGRHLDTLRKGGYITTTRRQYSLIIQINNWKPLPNYRDNKKKVKNIVSKLSGEIGHR